MSVQSGFLALLTMGPAYGSQLQGEFLARAAHRQRLNAGQVYATLERLAVQGLVESAGATEDGLPLYSLTEQGRDAADTWLRVAVTAGRPDWDEMLDQVLIAASIEGSTPASIVLGYREALDSVHTDPAGEVGTRAADSVALRSALSAAALNADAAVAWLGEVGAQLEADPRAFVRDRAATRPKRGRRPSAE